MSAKKMTSAFEDTVLALLPLSPEERRRVIEAVHALIDVGPGKRQRRDKKAPGRKRGRR
ncbi:MAG: hypothetical protein ACHQ2Z_17105 [Elusimicrobiota bacterium]